MGNICEICGINSLCYKWSTDRYFNREKMLELVTNPTKSERYKILKGDYVVCLACVHKYGL